MPIRYFLPVLALLAIGLSACPSRPHPLACQDACSHQDVKTFCDIDGVYPGTEHANECIAPPSADACNRIESCPVGATPFCTDDSMGVCAECLTGQDCGNGEICDVNNECAPFTCTPGPAGNTACEAADSSQPYCGTGDVCVGCLENVHCSTDGTAICAPGDAQCRGCEANSECDSRACNMSAANCLAATDILYVETGAIGTACTQALPCATIAEAIAKVTATTKTIVIAAGAYVLPVVLTDITVDLVGDGVVNIGAKTLAGGEKAVLVSGDSNVKFSGVNITPDGGGAGSVALGCEISGSSPTVVFEGGTISGSGDIGVFASSCDLTVTGSTISNNAGLGVTSSSGSLTVTGSTISRNVDGGIDVSNSDFEIVNNFIVKNGSMDASLGGLRISNAGDPSQVLQFNTIAGNVVSGILADATTVDCIANTAFTPSGNILYGGVRIDGTDKPSLSETNCVFEYSLIEGVGASGTILDEDPMFESDPDDYHIVPGSPCKDKADPLSTVSTDIDGEMRPQGDLPDIGADEVE